MFKCSICFFSNPKNSKYCQKCGFPILPKICNSKQCSNHDNMIELALNVKFCNLCGSETIISPYYSKHIEEFFKEKREDSKQKENKDKTQVDILLTHAVVIILKYGQCSVSLLQRKLNIGYMRAYRIIEQLELLKAVDTLDGKEPRKIFIKDLEDWDRIILSTV